MSSERYVSTIIHELGTSMGRDDLKLDENHRLALHFDQIPVTFHYTTQPVELLWLMADLGEIQPHDPQSLEGLMRLGFVTWLGNSMTVALREDGRSVFGHTAIPVINLDLPLLKQVISPFVSCAQELSERIVHRHFDLRLADQRKP